MNKDAAQHRRERVKGAVIEVPAFGLYFENSATTVVRLVGGG